MRRYQRGGNSHVGPYFSAGFALFLRAYWLCKRGVAKPAGRRKFDVFVEDLSGLLS
jgi:hypothetical protein